jgi:hypothetical protein
VKREVLGMRLHPSSGVGPEAGAMSLRDHPLFRDRPLYPLYIEGRGAKR